MNYFLIIKPLKHKSIKYMLTSFALNMGLLKHYKFAIMAIASNRKEIITEM